MPLRVQCKRRLRHPTGKDMKADPKQDESDRNYTFAERVRLNQQKLRGALKAQYDFIVCGSGSSGSVVARRLAENRDVSVLLLEAGGDDDVPSVMDADKWPMNLGSERDWNFHAEPARGVNGRVVPLSMGKVVGGGSSINVMIWSRGHKSDWDFFAAEAGNPEWNYESVLNIYRRIEDWHGTPDPQYRGYRRAGVCRARAQPQSDRSCLARGSP